MRDNVVVDVISIYLNPKLDFSHLNATGEAKYSR